VPLTRWITRYALILTLLWGVVVAWEPQAMNATPINAVARFCGFSHFTLVWLLISSSVGAWVAMLFPVTDLRSLYLMMPHQFVLLIGAFGSVAAVLTGTYADGVSRPMGFILADQLPWILSAIAYTLAIISDFGNKRTLDVILDFWRTVVWKHG